jgi:hypothetical protein
MVDIQENRGKTAQYCYYCPIKTDLSPSRRTEKRKKNETHGSTNPQKNRHGAGSANKVKIRAN